MIVSHKHKFIFVKTEKTAGTSMEIALSKYCGADDIITQISAEDEAIRVKLGYAGAQNYAIPINRYSKIDLVRLAYRGRRLRYTNHMRADEIIAYIGREVWDSYFKFCFERNPWDKVISWYYWRYKAQPRPSISDFIQSSEANIIKGFELYTLASEIAVDRVFFYESLGEALTEIGERLGLDETPELPQAKTGFRDDKRSYRALMSEADKNKIARVYAREIAHFGYEW